MACENVNGYKATPNQYVPGATIGTCTYMDADTAGAACDSNSDCVAFTVDSRNIGCLKSQTTPTAGTPGTCFYRKVS
ncbi:hypothetical protein PLESTF_001533700 [Pleodorina starrii]|nr:hypothetical protein PLESTF_001533700 [Pleodorina starrii]